MKTKRKMLWLATVTVVSACNGEIGTGIPGGDLSGVINNDGGFIVLGDGGILRIDAAINLCGDTDPGCMTESFGPPAIPFPLQGDPMPTTGESDNGIGRDANGYLILSTSNSNFNVLWIANTDDWTIGTLSKVDTHKVQEVSRYFSVTCYSNPAGGRQACDGTNGCCSRDDFTDYTFRAANGGMSSGKHQAVQTTMPNYPSRTAVDFNGDVWVANRAFGGQSSATKIANTITDCIERNGTPGIQTSSDVNGDGVIDTDCNGNGKPDDLADVKTTPCQAGRSQEFWGFDDECVLFTTNTGTVNQFGRPLALGKASVDNGPSDAWAGTFNDGAFYRIDGTTGLTKAQGNVGAKGGPGITPYGAAIDANGILWAVNLGGGLAYFDTGNPTVSAKVRTPTFSPLGGYGMTLDRDQNIWMGGYPTNNAYRYSPDRSAGFAQLANGFWTMVKNVGNSNGASGNGRGVAADSRTQASYDIWVARDGNPGAVARIRSEDAPMPAGADTTIDGSGFAAMQVAGNNTIGAGVDTDQNIWGISYGGSVATRIKVDAMGNMTKPDTTGGTAGKSCPVGAGDRCALNFTGTSTSADPYTYSDFTGFGLRNFTNPKGTWSIVKLGCGTQDTNWEKVIWDADVPANTTLTVRSGKTAVPDASWGPWTGGYTTSPADVKVAPGPMMPNPAPYMEVEFDFATTDRAATPRLKSMSIAYECIIG